MEVSLRKTQRAIFKMMQENPGCYLRHHKKTVNATRLYWRLMTKDHSPLMNITPGNLKQFFNLSLLVSIGQREWAMKEGVILIDKRKKKKQEEGVTLTNQ
jgi:hypothetical protein